MGEKQKQSQQKNSLKPKPAPEMPAAEQALVESIFEQVATVRNGAPIDLPSESNSRALRQAQIVQLQRQHGNAYVQRLLAQRSTNGQRPSPVNRDPSSTFTTLNGKSSWETRNRAELAQPAVEESTDQEWGRHGPPALAIPEPPPNDSASLAGVIQREVKAGGGVEVSSQSFKVALNVEPSKTVKAKYAEVKFSTPIGVSAELKSKGAAPASGGVESKSSGEKAAKASVEVYKAEAIAAGKTKFAELAYEDIEANGWEVDKVDWEGELGTAEEEGAGKVSMATGIKITFKNGQENTVKATLFEKSASVGLSGPKFEMEHKFSLANEKLWENADAELVASGSFSLKAEVSPNWTEIFAELAKHGGKEVARQFARAALRGVTSFLLGPGGFALGGLITVFAAYQSVQSIQAIKECVRAAEKAVESYVGGFCDSWGVSGLGISSAADWYSQGKKDGESRLSAQIKKIQSHPVFKPWNFTDSELRGALKSGLSKRGPEVYNQAKSEVQTKIYTSFVIEFYHKQKAGWLTPTYQAYNDAKWVARGLGLPTSVVPVED